MTGHLVLVVGPSGAGKDSLIDAARKHFACDPMFFFPRRVITRQVAHGAEDHDSLSPDAFARSLRHGAFYLHWQAHGLSYGLPAAAGDALRYGRIVVANVSRSIVGQAADAWPQTTVILVTASPDVLAARVAARGRSEDGDIQKRVTRPVDPIPISLPCITIKNEDALATAASAFCSALTAIQIELISRQ